MREEFLDDGPRRGSGIWGREANNNSFQVLQNMSVDAGSENSNVALEMLSRLGDSAVVPYESLDFALVEPTKTVFRGSGWSDLDKINVFRKLGFRRVGDSAWFMKASDQNHPSRILALEKDFDPPAAISSTAVQTFRIHLESKRTRAKRDGKVIDVSDSFRGHNEVDVIEALKIAREDEGSAKQRTYLQVKYGCDCSKCIGGFISPRMSFVLDKQLASVYRSLHISLSCDTARQRYATRPEMFGTTDGGYAWTFVEEPMKKLILDNKGVALGYCFVSVVLSEITSM